MLLEGDFSALSRGKVTFLVGRACLVPVNTAACPTATPARPSAAPPPRFGRANGGFYYHRRPTTACRRRVTPLWSQFPPHAHPQPPTLRPSNNAAPRTPRTTPIHNLTTAAFADATSTPPAPIGEPKLRAYPYADPLLSAPCPTATSTPSVPIGEPKLRAYPYADPLPSAPCPTATATPPTPTTEPEL